MAGMTNFWEEDDFDMDFSFKFDDEFPKPRKTSKIMQEIINSANKMEEEDNNHPRLECPICLEPFNLSKNTPHVLPCGHTLCKNCVLRLPSAIRKVVNRLRPFLIPFSVSCPWCNRLSPRLFCRGKLSFPPKNFFVLGMIDSKNCCNDSEYHSKNRENHERHAIFDFLSGLKTFLVSFPKNFSSCARDNPVFLLVSLILLMLLCAFSGNAVVLIAYVLVALCVWSGLMLFSELCFPDLV